MREVRGFVEATLTRWEVDSPAAVLVASELATNAVLHAQTRYTVVVRRTAASILVEVRDGDPRVPEPARRSRLAPDGRGLHIVDHLTREWGVQPRGHGKTVWGETSCEARRRPRPGVRRWPSGRMG